MSTYTVIGNTKVSSSASVIYRTLTIPSTTNQTYTLTLTKGSLGTLPSYTSTATSSAQTLSVPYGTTYSITHTGSTGYNGGATQSGTVNGSAVSITHNAASLKTFTFTITRSSNETITVTTNRGTYTSTFTAYYGDTWTASVTPADGYNAGTLSASSGTVTGAITISVSDAVEQPPVPGPQSLVYWLVNDRSQIKEVNDDVLL